MSRISFFQRYVQRENHATNNVLLALRYIYAESPAKFERLLADLLEDTVSIGPSFEQQIRGAASVPDGAIVQKFWSIHVEAKVGGSLDHEQIRAHCESIRQQRAYKEQKGEFLIGLTREPVSGLEPLRQDVEAYGIKFLVLTYTELLAAIRVQIEPHEADLAAVIDDFESFLADTGLLQQRDGIMPVFACGQSFAENERFGVYYEPPSRPSKAMYRFIGCYRQKAIRLVGEVAFVGVTHLVDGQIECDEHQIKHASRDLAAYLEVIRNAIEGTRYYDLSGPHRFYVVDKFYKTECLKVSPGGMMSLRYLDLRKLLRDKWSAGLGAADIAESLRKLTWE